MLMMSEQAAATPLRAKALGAYYTDAAVAEFLVRWAVRSPVDRVLDPSFGGGVFLSAASERLQELGGDPQRQVFGVDIDSRAVDSVGPIREAFHLRNLFSADFFDVTFDTDLSVAKIRLPRMDAVVGNPPYIRYQRFGGDSRAIALERAGQQAVYLPQLSSSWAPFVVHSVAMLKQGGRLALVLPNELTYASYAQPVLQFLRDSFAYLTILTFRKKLFPQLSETTLLLLADDRGNHGGAAVRHRDYPGFEDLLDETSLSDLEEIGDRDGNFVSNYLPRDARELYRSLVQSQKTFHLSSIADVGIGYVTGANDYFHPATEVIERFRIPKEFLVRAVRRGRALRGLVFTDADWEAARSTGDSGCLLLISPEAFVPNSLRSYLSEGEAAGIPKRYKCRTRQPWYSVPHVYRADMFLTYMNGDWPRLLVNEAGAVAPNTLHVVRFRGAADAFAIAAAWRTSLTRLSCEMEGRTLGGGMLKLEPTEAQRVILPNCSIDRAGAETLDACARAEGEAAAQREADAMILGKLGLTERECALLAEAAQTLRDRRCGRGVRSDAE